MKMIYGVFEGSDDAHGAITALEHMGFDKETLSVIAHENVMPQDSRADEAKRGLKKGAKTGAWVGGLLGLLTGVGLMTIPGFGPVLAAGPIVAALSSIVAGAGLGAAAGGLVGALVDWGVPDTVARSYADTVQRGGVLLAVHAKDAQVSMVKRTLDQHGAKNVNVYDYAWQGHKVKV